MKSVLKMTYVTFLQLPDEGKIVHWPPPPKEGEIVQILESSDSTSTATAKNSKFNISSKLAVDSTTQLQMDRPAPAAAPALTGTE